MAGNPAHTGDGVAGRGSDTDNDAVGNGKHLGGLQAIGLEQPADRLLNPIDFCSAEHQLAAQFNGDIQQLVVIHDSPS